MQIAKNIKKLRDEKDLMQKEVAKFFGLSIDELVHLNGKKYLKLLPLNTKLPEMLTKSKF